MEWTSLPYSFAKACELDVIKGRDRCEAPRHNGKRYAPAFVEMLTGTPAGVEIHITCRVCHRMMVGKGPDPAAKRN